MKVRLPAPKAMQCVSVLLDPATKSFAANLLSEDGLYDQTLELLKEKHHAAYKAMHCKTSAALPKEDKVLATPAATTDNIHDYYTDDLLGFTCELSSTETVGTVEVSDDTKANDLVDEWIKHSVSYHNHVYNSSHPIPESGNISLLELVAKFDTMQYFCEVGSKKWPTITMLARIHFSRMDNSAFQEWVYSTVANVQVKTQNRMAFEHLEKRTLIAHTKQLLRDKIV